MTYTAPCCQLPRRSSDIAALQTVEHMPCNGNAGSSPIHLPKLPAGFQDPRAHFVAPRPLKPNPGLVTQANGLT